MKQKMLFILVVLCVAMTASAKGNNRNNRGYPYPASPAAESVIVTGNLTIAQGALAVKSGTITYLTRGLDRYVGFIDSLKDGASVTLEGSAFTSPADANVKVLWISKLTIGGKVYDLARPDPVRPRW